MIDTQDYYFAYSKLLEDLNYTLNTLNSRINILELKVAKYEKLLAALELIDPKETDKEFLL